MNDPENHMVEFVLMPYNEAKNCLDQSILFKLIKEQIKESEEITPSHPNKSITSRRLVGFGLSAISSWDHALELSPCSKGYGEPVDLFRGPPGD